MALAECNTTVDESGRELIQHGTLAFPIACYHDDFRETDVPWHWHDELEAVLITEGSCTVAAGNGKITLAAGQGFFINSGILHGAWDGAASGCRFHSLVFHPRLVGGSLDSVFYQNYLRPLLGDPSLELVILSPEVSWQARALAAIEDAWQLCFHEPEGFEFQVREALSRVVFLLWGNIPSRNQPVSSKAVRDADRIKAMLSYIHENFGSELTIAQIAASAMISASEALRCFRATIGTTPIQYVRQYRIQQAAGLLAAGGKISDAAAACGFQDMSYFTRSFRALKGCTPTEFKKTSVPKG